MECITVSTSTNSAGYGQTHLRVGPHRKQYALLAHRVAWESEHGPIPAGMVVMHTCDNPACVNLEHLLLGTQRDNMRDKAAKGRGRNQWS